MDAMKAGRMGESESAPLDGRVAPCISIGGQWRPLHEVEVRTFEQPVGAEYRRAASGARSAVEAVTEAAHYCLRCDSTPCRCHAIKASFDGPGRIEFGPTRSAVDVVDEWARSSQLGAQVVRDTPEWRMHGDSILKELSALHDDLTRLEQRLEPVLRPAAAQAGHNRGGSAEPAGQCATALDGLLATVRATLATRRAYVLALEARLGL
jgi:hypothetical protein